MDFSHRRKRCFMVGGSYLKAQFGRRLALVGRHFPWPRSPYLLEAMCGLASRTRYICQKGYLQLLMLKWSRKRDALSRTWAREFQVRMRPEASYDFSSASRLAPRA